MTQSKSSQNSFIDSMEIENTLLNKKTEEEIKGWKFIVPKAYNKKKTQQKKNNQNMKQNNEKVGNPKEKMEDRIKKQPNLKEKSHLKIQQVKTNEGIKIHINMKDLQQGNNNIVRKMINQFDVLSSLNENEINNEENQDLDENESIKAQEEEGNKESKDMDLDQIKKQKKFRRIKKAQREGPEDSLGKLLDQIIVTKQKAQSITNTAPNLPRKSIVIDKKDQMAPELRRLIRSLIKLIIKIGLMINKIIPRKIA